MGEAQQGGVVNCEAMKDVELCLTYVIPHRLYSKVKGNVSYGWEALCLAVQHVCLFMYGTGMGNARR